MEARGKYAEPKIPFNAVSALEATATLVLIGLGASVALLRWWSSNESVQVLLVPLVAGFILGLAATLALMRFAGSLVPDGSPKAFGVFTTSAFLLVFASISSVGASLLASGALIGCVAVALWTRRRAD